MPTRNSAIAVDVVDTRASLLSAEKLIRGDKYTFIRNAYLQNREYKVKDGEVVDDF
ncbi:VacJ like lipoprotein [compost metagenome]